MSVTVSAANFTRNMNAGTTTCTLVIPQDVPLHAAIVLGIGLRNPGTTNESTLPTISDPVNGTWSSATIRQGPNGDTGGTGHRTWFAVLTDSAALSGASNRTITVTFEATCESYLIGGWAESTLGALTYDAAATVLQKSTNDTNWDSNTAAATGAGVAFGFAYVNNVQGGAPTMDGAGESSLVAYTVSTARTLLFSETFSGSGNYGFEVTIATTARGNFHVVALAEPIASADNLLIVPRRQLFISRRIVQH